MFLLQEYVSSPNFFLCPTGTIVSTLRGKDFMSRSLVLATLRDVSSLLFLFLFFYARAEEEELDHFLFSGYFWVYGDGKWEDGFFLF